MNLNNYECENQMSLMDYEDGWKPKKPTLGILAATILGEKDRLWGRYLAIKDRGIMTDAFLARMVRGAWLGLESWNAKGFSTCGDFEGAWWVDMLPSGLTISERDWTKHKFTWKQVAKECRKLEQQGGLNA